MQFPGAICHVMSHGDRREEVFGDEVDRQDFLKSLAETCQKTGFEVQAYPWSSLVWCLAAVMHRPGWMRVTNFFDVVRTTDLASQRSGRCGLAAIVIRGRIATLAS